MDADSEIITAVNVPPANQDEAANAIELVKQEQKAQGKRVEALSIDGIGFRGDVLRELQDPHGLGWVVYVPPRDWSNAGGPYFTANVFHLKEDGIPRVCPANQETQSRFRNDRDRGWQFSFSRRQCEGCTLRSECMLKLPANHGRQVNLNDYEAEYQAAREFAQTETFREVRKQHPKIERKLAEIIRYHQGRRTRFRGNDLVSIQYLMTTLAVNLKRIVKLLLSPACQSLAEI